MNDNKPSKTQTSFLRRLLVAYLIDRGFNTVPAIVEATNMPRRTAQDTIKAIHELEIKIEHTKGGEFKIIDWGAVNRDWIENNRQHVCDVLNYPSKFDD